MRYRLLIFLMAAMTLMPARAQQTRLLTADKHNEYGLVYNLPRTVLYVDVVAERTVCKAGPYSLYAKKYLSAGDFIAEDSEQWTVTSVKVTPWGEADPDAQYLMQLKPGAVTSIQVAEDGMLLSINTEVAVPDLSAPAAGTDLTYSSLDKEEYLQYVGEDFLGAQSRAKRAQLLWEALMEVRNARLSLSKGTAETMPADGRQLELMLASLQKQEQAITDAFLGTVQKQTVVRRYRFVPDEDNAEVRNVICRLDPATGLSTSTGEPLYLTIEETSTPTLPVDDKGETKKIPKDAVMYAVPAGAVVTLRLGSQQLLSQPVEIAQYGMEFGLAPALFTDKKAPSYATFDPVTGALSSIGEVGIGERK